ncbi:ERF family protein [Pseudomonas paracarnis]|uniref:ERF family protein n=1 Tax=Pseudomonas paracarnis TaxID=2750625 RepID=A0ABU6BVD6_9PSED|nr:ERF family protein [Pseudomonas paracarnis]MBW9244132.1 ERF family protein [Pseudomonas paracarnis]MEB3783706.1 ERF family protein [Pseudomonas paracarnis]
MSQEIIMPLGRDRQMAAQEAPAQEISMLSTISRLALDPRCDMDKLERLISLQDRMEAKTALEAFNASFAEMQCEMPSVEKRTENTHTKKMYADLDDINYAVRPVMAKFGFGVSFKIVNQANGVSITGILMHKSGHREETTMILPLDIGAGRSAVQSVGSTTTYGKRYVMCALLNITSGDDNDNDGYKEPTDPLVTPVQARQVQALLDKCSETAKGKFADLYGEPANVTKANFDSVLAALTKSANNNQQV